MIVEDVVGICVLEHLAEALIMPKQRSSRTVPG
jgi:hypothetical protein